MAQRPHLVNILFLARNRYPTPAHFPDNPTSNRHFDHVISSIALDCGCKPYCLPEKSYYIIYSKSNDVYCLFGIFIHLRTEIKPLCSISLSLLNAETDSEGSTFHCLACKIHQLVRLSNTGSMQGYNRRADACLPTRQRRSDLRFSRHDYIPGTPANHRHLHLVHSRQLSPANDRISRRSSLPKLT